MLAALIANLQNVPTEELTAGRQRSTVREIGHDSGGGGSVPPRYDFVDVAAAVQLFPEIAGENPISRAVRRARWIEGVLPYVREAREQREASVFLTGLQFGYAAGYEAGSTPRQPSTRSEVGIALAQSLSRPAFGAAVAQWLPPSVGPASASAPSPIDRGATDRAGRGGAGSGAGLFVAVLAIGAIGLAVWAGNRRRKS